MISFDIELMMLENVLVTETVYKLISQWTTQYKWNVCTEDCLSVESNRTV